MQSRVGPPILQPYYDVMKLFSKERVEVSSTQSIYVIAYLLSCIVAGAAFFFGGNFLLVAFVLTLGSLFFIMAAYSTRSPYAEVGAEREMLQVMAYEPMVLLMAVAFYMSCGSFDVATIITGSFPMIATCPLLFIGFVYILLIKLRKSPFDLSMSHHAHQELVKGITTELSGHTLGGRRDNTLVRERHVLRLACHLRHVVRGLLTALVVILTLIIVYIFVIWVDNNYARVKWKRMLNSTWWLAFVLGAINLSVIPYILRLIL